MPRRLANASADLAIAQHPQPLLDPLPGTRGLAHLLRGVHEQRRRRDDPQHPVVHQRPGADHRRPRPRGGPAVSAGTLRRPPVCPEGGPEQEAPGGAPGLADPGAAAGARGEYAFPWPRAPFSSGVPLAVLMAMVGMVATGVGLTGSGRWYHRRRPGGSRWRHSSQAGSPLPPGARVFLPWIRPDGQISWGCPAPGCRRQPAARSRARSGWERPRLPTAPAGRAVLGGCQAPVPLRSERCAGMPATGPGQ